MDLRVATGEDLGGEGLSEEVKERIERAEASRRVAENRAGAWPALFEAICRPAPDRSNVRPAC
jgi:hypothetical protein